MQSLVPLKVSVSPRVLIKTLWIFEKNLFLKKFSSSVRPWEICVVKVSDLNMFLVVTSRDGTAGLTGVDVETAPVQPRTILQAEAELR